MRIIWDETTQSEWQTLLGRVPRSNLLNTVAYAHAVRQHQQMMTRFGVIEIDGKPRGLLEIQEAGLGKIIHALTVHRGPLWLDRPATEEEWAIFLQLFNTAWPRRPGRIRRFLPELEDTPGHRSLMEEYGFKRVGEGYRTLWLDLGRTEDELRKTLRGKWRNALNGAERAGLTVRIDDEGAKAPWLLTQYGVDKAERKYGGARPRFLRQMIADLVPRQEALILQAVDSESPVAGVLVMLHGSSATYQVGWSDDRGRKARAHHLLLWQAVLTLKERGIQSLDLGGTNPEDAEGVTRFKAGLGGLEYQTVGLYR